MGAGAGGYLTITLRTRLSEYNATTDELHRISELAFMGAPVPDDPAHSPLTNLDKIPPGPPPGRPPAAKLGLGGVRPRDVLAFNLYARMDDDSLVSMGVQQDKGITAELGDAFGGDWAGYGVGLAPTGGRFSLVADITVKPAWKKRARRPFQIIPVVIAFGTDRFVDHYLLAVVAAQETLEKVDVSVTQSYQ